MEETNLTHVWCFPGLKEVPQEFGKLVHLQSVQLEVCSMWRQSNLEDDYWRILLQGNPLVAPFSLLYKKNPLLLMEIFNTEVQDWLGWKYATALPRLYFCFTHFIFFCRQATHLDISNAGLDDLPSFIGRLTGLLRLDLRNNLLSTLPTELGMLTQLRVCEQMMKMCWLPN